MSNPNTTGYDWSPDGRRIVYSLGEHYLHFYSFDAVTGWSAPESIPLPHNAYGPTWSPDGSTVAYSNTRIYTISANLTQQASPTLIAESGKGYLQSQVWSPAGDYFAYMLLKLQMYPPNLYDTFRMTRTSASKTDLTSSSFGRETGEKPIRWTGN